MRVSRTQIVRPTVEGCKVELESAEAVELRKELDWVFLDLIPGDEIEEYPHMHNLLRSLKMHNDLVHRQDSENVRQD